MRQALRLARRGWESVAPNPMVGAVLVRGGRVVGKGFHRRCGGPHAEVEALGDADRPRGATMYVTLEPCGHRGRTPPCAAAILEAGVKRVIYASGDPNPLTAGRGPRALRRGGVEVLRGPCEREAQELNAPFFQWVTTGRPWVVLKWAMTLDGKIATVAGESQWITGAKARQHAHRLRRRVNAVLVGTNTVLADDPQLTPRPSRGRRPARVVLDRRGRVPFEARVFEADPDAGPTFYITSAATLKRRRRRLEALGATGWAVGRGLDGGLNLGAVVHRLGKAGCAQVLVEGGAQVLGGFLSAELVDEVAVYVAPRLAGGRTAPGAIGGAGVRGLSDTPWLCGGKWRRLGEDFLFTARRG